MRIGLVTDSTARLGPAEAQRLRDELAGHFDIVELTVSVDGAERPDSQWSPADVCTAMAAGLPVTTSMPAAGDFADAYRRLIADGAEALIVLTLSAELSGTWQAARAAADEVMAEGDATIAVIDARTISAGLAGAVAIAAAGAQLEPDQLAAEVADWCSEETRAFFVPASLEYLRRGGRIGAASSLIGRALSIVPVLGLRDGAVVPLARVRTRARAEERMAALLLASAQEFADRYPGRGIEIVLLHAEETAAAAGAPFARLHEQVRALPLPEGTRVSSAAISTVVTAHVGPGTVGAFVQTAP
ncbi:DegV family EDD domain-containing protein [Brevibacterium sp. 5221]|uniref:DegV family EDD domain-containing protein n=1 Tax=Brevibacterium rongguiense TaxID=2695267 RepID=A0A6N9H8V6_9MICO|nr:DegV family protein [Brevibacterium rongguiense]MYM20520.1 DegV family EDD domain-containing protein [Brevibacterium rongguiense]